MLITFMCYVMTVINPTDSSHLVCLSVTLCVTLILENAPFSGLKLTSVQSR